MKQQQKMLLPFVCLFLAITLLVLPFSARLKNWQLDSGVLMAANLLFFVTTVAVFSIQQKALHNVNPNVFVRSILSGVMIKMLVCVVAIIVYRLLFSKSFSKVSVFVAMFFYLFYLAVEVTVLMKMNKQKNA